MFFFPRSRRSEFETRLEDFLSEVDLFREKEVPRQLEEIMAVVAKLDELGNALEAAKAEAMVCVSL